LDVKKFYGVGKVTKEKMYRLGIFTGKDLIGKSLEFLEENFGKSGVFYYNVVRGIHNGKVKASRTQKSLAAEHTFSENISSEIFMLERLEEIAAEVEKRLHKSKLAGKTITLKIKYRDFTLQTRSKTVPLFIASKELIMEIIKELLFQERMKESVRLLGISISNLNNEKPKKAQIPKESIDVQLKLAF